MPVNTNLYFKSKTAVNSDSYEDDKVEEELISVSTNFPKFKSLVSSIISTIRVFSEQSIDSETEKELLSEKVLPLTDPQKKELSQFHDVFDVNKTYIFKDLAKNNNGENDRYIYDKRRSLILAKELTRIFGEKKVSFFVPSCKSGDLEVKPVSSREYASGVPFLLSCLPNFCDFVGGFGGNYPTSEYMTNKAVSMKIYNKGQYLGHFNLWQTSEEDYIIGTIAIPRNNKVKNFSDKFRALLNRFSLELLINNNEANNIFIGLGGANMSSLNSKIFGFSESKGSGYELVKSIRHIDDINNPKETENENISRFKSVSGFNVRGNIKLAENNPFLNDEYYMGMSADDRKDFKNAIIYTNREKIDTLKVSTEKEDEVAKNTPVVKTAAQIKAERAARWAKK